MRRFLARLLRRPIRIGNRLDHIEVTNVRVANDLTIEHNWSLTPVTSRPLERV